MLWKIEKDGLPGTSYLYGKMHVQDSRVFEFSDAFLPAFFSCDAYAMEVHPDEMEKYYYLESFHGRNSYNSGFDFDWNMFSRMFTGNNDYDEI